MPVGEHTPVRACAPTHAHTGAHGRAGARTPVTPVCTCTAVCWCAHLCVCVLLRYAPEVPTPSCTPTGTCTCAVPAPTSPQGAPRANPGPGQQPPAVGDAAALVSPGISPTVKKTEMDKSPFNSPSPQDSSPRLSSFTQHHRPVIAVHSGECAARETEAGSQWASGQGGWGSGHLAVTPVGLPFCSCLQVLLGAHTHHLLCISPPPPSSPRRPPPTSPTRPSGTRLISTRRTH